MRTEYYKTDDLIVNESFISWVLEPENDKSDYWENYLKEDNNKSLQVEKAKALVIKVNTAKVSPAKDQKDKILENINSEITSGNNSEPSAINWSLIRKIAAMFVFVICAYILVNTSDKNQFKTGFNEMQTIYLPDGSQVVLNSNSTFEFADNWEGSLDREVWLQGEAYFNVRKGNPKTGKKFVVYTDDLNVTVLGTQFNVNTHEETTDVVLEEGQINVEYTAADKVESKYFTMLPGQKTRFNSVANKYQISEVNTSVYTSWKDGTIVFDGTPLSELKNVIENNYGYQVIFEREELLSKKLDGKIDNPNLATLLSTLETIFNLQIEKRGKQIIITE